jgi:hypothetical protein
MKECLFVLLYLLTRSYSKIRHGRSLCKTGLSAETSCIVAYRHKNKIIKPSKKPAMGIGPSRGTTFPVLQINDDYDKKAGEGGLRKTAFGEYLIVLTNNI